MQSKKKRRFRNILLPFALALIVAHVQQIISSIALYFCLFLPWQHGYLQDSPLTPAIVGSILSANSILVGTVFAAILLRFPLHPLREISEATDKIAAGDYSVRVKPRGFSEFRDLGEKFNRMAEELSSVELLRSDFVNNFSHEFKTPIVSIRGFARILQNDDLSPEERAEYLSIIIEESERLSSLSENVLQLSKLEQQTILSDKRPYNISEQLRLCIALLDQKWSEKQIEFVFDCEEVTVSASEELLKQVWINLLDNAMKFSPAKGTVTVTAACTEQGAVISISNGGEPISPEAMPHLFEKFFQGDSSHGTTGNGLGLSLAQRIVALHGGTIRAASDANVTTFTVHLPLA